MPILPSNFRKLWQKFREQAQLREAAASDSTRTYQLDRLSDERSRDFISYEEL